MAQAAPKRVLIVHSFGTVAPPFTTHSTAFEAELVKRMGNRVDLDEVSLDMARYAAPDMQEAIVKYLETRSITWKPDLVVPIGGPAGIFVAKFRQRLFSDIPILYCSLDQRLLGPGALDQNATFIGANYEVKGFVEDILQIAPGTQNIAVVIGATPLEKYWAEVFRKGFEPFMDRLNFIWLNDLSFDQMLEGVQKLPPHSFIFLILFLRDAAGVTQNADEALQRLHAVANAPINSIFTSQMGLGIVGGRLYPSTEDGMQAAATAVEILNGASPLSFPPRIVPATAPQYDWRELQRWKINEKRLPSGSTVLFREPNIWQQYKGWIIGGLTILALQAVLITGLIANLIRRRRAEGSLAESEQRFQTMANATPTMIWMSGPDKLCTFLNKAWVDFRGRAMEQDIGFGWKEGIHPDDLADLFQAYEKAFDAREPFVVRFRLLRHDGEYRWITAQGIPRYDSRLTFVGYVGACVDVTDLLQKEEALRESEERIALAAEAAHIGVWELDLQTNNVWMSDKARALFQFTSDRNVSWAEFQSRVHPDDRAARNAAIKQALETEKGADTQFRSILPNGIQLWIGGRVRCVKDGGGHFTRILGVSADITERRQAEELFRLATEASPTGILLVNSDGRIVLVNAHTEELFGYSRDELIGKPVEILVPERFAGGAPALRAKFFAAPEKGMIGPDRELFGQRKDGTEFPVEVSLNPIETIRGKLVLASVVDTSARKAAEEEAQRHRDEMSRLERISLLGEMTASISHEINQPLSGIITNASAGLRFMDRSSLDPEKIREILVDVVADGQRAHSVIHSIRSTIKGTATRQRLVMNDIVTNVIRMVRSDAAAHSCELHTSLATDLPPIEADPVQIQQVLINLVSNAIDAVREVPASRRKVEIATHNGDSQVRLTVRDYGAGIAPEVRDRLFQQFFTTKDEGLGMGLAIVRSIVEAHAGHVAAENADGAGARFVVTLPASE